jgi:hypothetical protein
MADFTIADVLAKARKLIEQRGWTREAYCKAGRLCAIGAIRFASNGDETDGSGISRKAEIVFAEAVGTRATLNWNDRQPSKKPVIEAFKRAEQIARSSYMVDIDGEMA